VSVRLFVLRDIRASGAIESAVEAVGRSKSATAAQILQEEGRNFAAVRRHQYKAPSIFPGASRSNPPEHTE